MIFHRVSDDWVTAITGPLRADVCRTLRSLDLARLQKYPPPKLVGLKFGNETRVLRRFLQGRSSTLDASALSSWYRTFASARDRLLYRAFRQNDALTRDEWTTILAEGADAWQRHHLLAADGDRWRCRFSVVAIDGVLYVVDPLNDHGGPHQTVALNLASNGGDPDLQQFNHVYIGQDSLRMIEFMAPESYPADGRYLDCGNGAGALLLYFGRRFAETVGIDINRRSVAVASFNAELNGLPGVHCHLDNALTLGSKYGRFDLVTWNLPFNFIPVEYKDIAIDGYGGDLGIELCMQFIDTLPPLLKPAGVAHVAAVSPMLENGAFPLEDQLRDVLPRLRLDCVLQVLQWTWADVRSVWEFHRQHRIKRFESADLALRPGTGKLTRVEAPVGRQLVDVVREKMYHRHFGARTATS